MYYDEISLTFFVYHHMKKYAINGLRDVGF